MENVSVLVPIYGFTTKEDDKAGDIAQMCVESLGGHEPLDMGVSFVRNITTRKDMKRSTFRLTRDIPQLAKERRLK